MISSEYLYLVKNLRGIIYFSDKSKAEKEIEWLKRKFRYRKLGIAKSLKEKSKLKLWDKLEILSLPFEVNLKLNSEIESMLLASSFLSPLLILKEETLTKLSNFLILGLKTKEVLDDRELKRNIRLANYSITDFYLKAIKADRKEKVKIAREDLKRFWRIKESKEGKSIIVYLDPKLEVKHEVYRSIIPCVILDFS